MKNHGSRIIDQVKKYRFELSHLTILFIVLIIFQLIIAALHKISLQNFVVKTQEWYQKDSAERLANLTTTSLELLLETRTRSGSFDAAERTKIIQDLNIIFSQQILHKNVEEVCILVSVKDSVYAIDDGAVLYAYVFENLRDLPPPTQPHHDAVRIYRGIMNKIRSEEQIYTTIANRQTFHNFVPFVPRGEFLGAGYMKNTPDFSLITKEVITSFDETALTYSGLILGGLLVMFFASSYTIKERDEAKQLLFDEQKKFLAKEITAQKELMFTKRIYHTHHKAEKVMGFIKEDVRSLSAGNIERIKYRITKYANFIARVIYDMKWYDPPVHTIRSTIFRTNINEMLKFLVENLFERVSVASTIFNFSYDLDAALPTLQVNEYVVWEVVEPLIQNSLDHADVNPLHVLLTTRYDAEKREGTLTISDNGKGIRKEFLLRNEEGTKQIFLEHVSEKTTPDNEQAGYGCYIAYQIATERLGWELDVENRPEGGCQFTITIKNI
ncbi:MAG TPA: ATP-binding protein [Bacteroidota bacterium]|nr:ATP-binding protein [Bacteroidota bacterium]